jgi:hypothetical protein
MSFIVALLSPVADGSRRHTAALVALAEQDCDMVRTALATWQVRRRPFVLRRQPPASCLWKPTHRPREPHSGRPSSATGALAGSSGLRRSEPQLHPPLLARRSALDPPGGVVERPAAAGALRHPSERLPMEQLDYNLLFRWFVGLSPDDRVGPNLVQQERERLQQDRCSTSSWPCFWNSPRSK